MNNFFIKQYSQSPILVMKIDKENCISKNTFHKSIQNSAISFSMKDADTGLYKIINGIGGILLKDKHNIFNEDEFYVYYRFKAKDVRKAGKFIGEFKINFFNLDGSGLEKGVYIGPINEPLYIYIKKSNEIPLPTSDPIPEIENIVGYSTSSVDPCTIEDTPVIYYKIIINGMPKLYTDEQLTIPLSGYIKNFEEDIVLRYYNGQAIGII